MSERKELHIVMPMRLEWCFAYPDPEDHSVLPLKPLSMDEYCELRHEIYDNRRELAEAHALIDEAEIGLKDIQFKSHMTSSCEHRQGVCPYKLAAEILAKIKAFKERK